MKRWFSVLICVSVLTGCALEERPMEENVELEIRTEVFEQDDIKVQYPQIYGMEDEEKESRINEIIYDHVLEMIYYDPMVMIYTVDGVDYEGKVEQQMEYEVTFLNEHMISILYQGEEKLYSVPWMASYDSYCVDSLTVDLDEMKKMELNDFVEVDEEFIQKMKESSNILLAGGKVEMSQEIKERIVDEEKMEIILRGFTQKWGYYRFCVAPDKLIVSIDVGRQAGDYALIEIPYEWSYGIN